MTSRAQGESCLLPFCQDQLDRILHTPTCELRDTRSILDSPCQKLDWARERGSPRLLKSGYGKKTCLELKLFVLYSSQLGRNQTPQEHRASCEPNPACRSTWPRYRCAAKVIRAKKRPAIKTVSVEHVPGDETERLG
jgi:hypothetical protein